MVNTFNKIYDKQLLAFLLLLTVGPTGWANIRLPALISDNMVLQQQSEITLWGWADPGEQVTITPGWAKKTVVMADNAGAWSASVKTPKAGKAQSILFKGKNAITVNNVLMGEVWLASGQSNMEFFVGKGEGWRTGVNNYEQEIPKADYPLIRMIDVPNTVSDSLRSNFEGKWEICSPTTVGSFSAVAYYFAIDVQKETGYPIGIINATWGGTPAESWTRKDILENDKDLKPILDRYQKACDAYPDAYAQYKEKLAAWKSDTSSKKKGAPKEPVGPNHNKSPYKLYNGMIAPLLPYKLKGVIWYQGESNATYAWQYRRLFPAMIASWRADFKQPELPFYFVQIAPHKGQNPVIREAQLYTYQTVPHTGMAVTTDVGDADDIHPRDKKTVGGRLALWALHNEYQNDKKMVSGPLYKSMSVQGSRIILSFDYAKGMTAKGDSLTEFMIAGKDEVFVEAKAEIRGDQIIVWADQVKEPVAVRFAWQNVPRPNLFNGEGLPASPFRTDQWEVETQGKN